MTTSLIIRQIVILIIMLSLLHPQMNLWMDHTFFVKVLIIVSFATLAALFLTPIIKIVSFKLNILDKPDETKAHKEPTPLLGGLALYISFISTIYLVGTFYPNLRWVMMAVSLVLIIGILDDTFTIPAKTKLVVQLVAVVLLIKGGVVFTFLPNNIYGIVGEYLLTALWIVGITNAINFMDGLDGLASGLSLIAFAFFGLIAIKLGQTYYSIIALALAGGCLGFLPFNFKAKRRAEIFLGDSGSTFLGFMLASLAIMGTWAENSLVSLSIPIIILLIPIYDMFLTTINRLYFGEVSNFSEWLEYRGKDHIHHRLVRITGGDKIAVLLIILLTFTFGLDSYVLIDSPLNDSFVILGKYVVLALVLTYYFVFYKRKD